ncbi:MAG: hypothetical protein K8L99_06855 [Anaerolineae bacterium]|nr:hypothetical protein [Anaerolineae bacterium]
MELRTVLRILLRRWWLIAIPLLIVAAFVVPDLLSQEAVSSNYVTTIHYSAAQQPEAMPPRDGDFQDIWLASEYTVNAMTSWALTESFRAEIVQQAAAQNVDVNAALLGIAADNQRSVGQLTFSYPDAEALSAIVNAAIEVLKTQNLAYFPQMGNAPADVTILDTPVIVPAPPPLANRFAPFIRLGLGLIAGIGLALLAHYLDPFVRSKEDIETLGLPVIVTLPRH